MTSNETTRVCVFGCGRWLRRDDQAGLMVAEKLAQADLPEADVRATESPAADLIADLDGVGLLVVVDAAQSGPNVPAGTWRRLEYGADPGRIGARPPPVDVHQLSVDTALRLAAEMGLLPPEVWVYAAAAGDCGYGEAMTPAVEAAVSELARRIPADIEAWRRQRMGRGA